MESWDSVVPGAPVVIVVLLGTQRPNARLQSQKARKVVRASACDACNEFGWTMTSMTGP